ncbi:MAG: hypothetical protein R6U96_18485 [Promethearchaeia archaeon]
MDENGRFLSLALVKLLILFNKELIIELKNSEKLFAEMEKEDQ